MLDTTFVILCYSKLFRVSEYKLIERQRCICTWGNGLVSIRSQCQWMAHFSDWKVSLTTISISMRWTYTFQTWLTIVFDIYQETYIHKSVAIGTYTIIRNCMFLGIPTCGAEISLGSTIEWIPYFVTCNVVSHWLNPYHEWSPLCYTKGNFNQTTNPYKWHLIHLSHTQSKAWWLAF